MIKYGPLRNGLFEHFLALAPNRLIPTGLLDRLKLTNRNPQPKPYVRFFSNLGIMGATLSQLKLLSNILAKSRGFQPIRK